MLEEPVAMALAMEVVAAVVERVVVERVAAVS